MQGGWNSRIWKSSFNAALWIGSTEKRKDSVRGEKRKVKDVKGEIKRKRNFEKEESFCEGFRLLSDAIFVRDVKSLIDVMMK